MKLSRPQKRALIGARDHDNAWYDVFGRSQAGGWISTIESLKKRGLLDDDEKITLAGRAALEGEGS